MRLAAWIGRTEDGHGQVETETDIQRGREGETERETDIQTTDIQTTDIHTEIDGHTDRERCRETAVR